MNHFQYLDIDSKQIRKISNKIKIIDINASILGLLSILFMTIELISNIFIDKQQSDKYYNDMINTIGDSIACIQDNPANWLTKCEKGIVHFKEDSSCSVLRAFVCMFTIMLINPIMTTNSDNYCISIQIQSSLHESKISNQIYWYICIQYNIIIFKIILNMHVLCTSDSLFSTNLLWWLLLEELYLVIMLPPKVNYSFIGVQQKSIIIYTFDSLVSIWMIWRVYLFWRVFIWNNMWESEKTNHVCANYELEIGKNFPIKAQLKNAPYIVIGIVLGILIYAFGYDIKMLEQPYEYISGLVWDYVTNGMWNTVIAMATVGYGDYYPRTHLGRFCILWACFIGQFLISLMVVAFTNTSQLSENESNAYWKYRARIKKLNLQVKGCLLIQHAYFLYCLLKKKNKLMLKRRKIYKANKLIILLKKSVINFRLVRKEISWFYMQQPIRTMISDISEKIDHKYDSILHVMERIPFLAGRSIRLLKKQQRISDILDELYIKNSQMIKNLARKYNVNPSSIYKPDDNNNIIIPCINKQQTEQLIQQNKIRVPRKILEEEDISYLLNNNKEKKIALNPVICLNKKNINNSSGNKPKFITSEANLIALTDEQSLGECLEPNKISPSIINKKNNIMVPAKEKIDQSKKDSRKYKPRKSEIITDIFRRRKALGLPENFTNDNSPIINSNKKNLEDARSFDKLISSLESIAESNNNNSESDIQSSKVLSQKELQNFPQNSQNHTLNLDDIPLIQNDVNKADETEKKLLVPLEKNPNKNYPGNSRIEPSSIPKEEKTPAPDFKLDQNRPLNQANASKPITKPKNADILDDLMNKPVNPIIPLTRDQQNLMNKPVNPIIPLGQNQQTTRVNPEILQNYPENSLNTSSPNKPTKITIPNSNNNNPWNNKIPDPKEKNPNPSNDNKKDPWSIAKRNFLKDPHVNTHNNNNPESKADLMKDPNSILKAMRDILEKNQKISKNPSDVQNISNIPNKQAPQFNNPTLGNTLPSQIKNLPSNNTQGPNNDILSNWLNKPNDNLTNEYNNDIVNKLLGFNNQRKQYKNLIEIVLLMPTIMMIIIPIHAHNSTCGYVYIDFIFSYKVHIYMYNEGF